MNSFEGMVLNNSFEPVYVIDSYISFIWTDKYDEAGDFEIVLPYNKKIVDSIYTNNNLYNFISFNNSVHTGIVENVIINNKLSSSIITIKGRTLEAILDNRIVWNQTTVNGNFANGISNIFTSAFNDNSIPGRAIDNFYMKQVTDPYILSLKNNAQYTGDSVYEIVTKNCKRFGIGFSVIYDHSDERICFSLYNGRDLSYNNAENNDIVVFSNDYNNLISSKFQNNKEKYKNVAHIGGQGQGPDRKWVTIGSSSGINRREVYVNASDISNTFSQNDKTYNIVDSDYNIILSNRGYEKMNELQITISNEGSIDTSSQFIYGKDFNLGDIIEYIDIFGNENKVRINEILFSQSEHGSTIIPKLTKIENVGGKDEH